MHSVKLAKFITLCCLAKALAEEAAKNEKAAELQWEAPRAAQSHHDLMQLTDMDKIQAMESEVFEEQAMLREDRQAMTSAWCS